MSTMLVLMVMGTFGGSRSCSWVQSGMAKRVRFSYRANRRRRPFGVLPSVLASLKVPPSLPCFSYSPTALESRWRTSKT